VGAARAPGDGAERLLPRLSELAAGRPSLIQTFERWIIEQTADMEEVVA